MNNNASPKGKHRATTMKQVAEAAGVHPSTVSLALRNSPQLPTKTRDKLQKLAFEMGYQPNPMVSALMQQRRTGKASRFHGILAFIARSPNCNALQENSYVAMMYKLAAKYALEHGYKLDPFEIGDYGYNSSRLEKALHQRNIRGLLFPPPDSPYGNIVDLNWEYFTTVTMSTSIINPPMDRVDTDHHQGTRMALTVCKERGYKRPGYISLFSSDYRTQGRWRGGFLSFFEKTTVFDQIPFLVEHDAELPEKFKEWFLEWKPDVILANSLALQSCIPVLKKLGFSIPDQIAIVELNIHDLKNPHSGIYTGLDVSCQRAVEYLINNVHRNRFGLPQNPLISLTNPTWKEGNTLPYKTK